MSGSMIDRQSGKTLDIYGFNSSEGPFQRCRRLTYDKYIHAERHLGIFLCVGMWEVNALFKSKAGSFVGF